MRRTLQRLSIPLREPFVSSLGLVPREVLLLREEDADGASGIGEAAPFEPYDGVSTTAVTTDLLAGSHSLPQSQSAAEMARLDREARRAGRAVGEAGSREVPVNLTLPAGEPEDVAARALAGMREGYGCFKLKVGLPDDEERVVAVREAIGAWPALRLDANGAWSAREAIEALRRLATHDLELVEQPCRTLEELRQVRRAVSVPIAADESIARPADVDAAAELEACDAVNVKLSTSGGYTAARHTLRTAADHGLRAYLSSTFDGPWGIAAALQLAGAEGVSMACGLATLGMFDARLAEALPGPRLGGMEVPPGPGFGVTVGASALAEVLVEEWEQ